MKELIEVLTRIAEALERNGPVCPHYTVPLPPYQPYRYPNYIVTQTSDTIAVNTGGSK